MIKQLLLITALLSASAAANDETLAKQLIDNAYAKVGLSYKFNEAEVRWDGGATNKPIGARFEIGTKYKNFTFGYSHHSNLQTGFPFNDDREYFKDEFFIDYEIKLSEVF